jgi:hypothetical protein
MTVLRRGLPQSDVVSPGPKSRSLSGIAGCPVLHCPRASLFVSSQRVPDADWAAGVSVAHR